MKHFIVISIIALLASCSGNSESPRSVRTGQNDTGDNKVLLYKDVVFTDTVQMLPVSKGNFVPLYGNKKKQVQVEEFLMDIHPVTNRQYLQFLKCNPQWRKSNISGLFADANYLSQWLNDSTIAAGENWEAPVTNISWFAAKAYSHCAGKQLPTLNEWEYVAMADETSQDARLKKTFNQYILGWYEKPKNYAIPVMTTFRNYWGIWDMHGLVWEWTYDFNEIMISGESRRDVSNDDDKFCGSGSVGATDLMNYAAFMRYAFRGSVKANYCLKNLGFRCIKKEKK